MDPRIQELLELARDEGIRLPFDPEYIIALEDLGRVVDLRTGRIFVPEEDFLPTPQAEARCHHLLPNLIKEIKHKVGLTN